MIHFRNLTLLLLLHLILQPDILSQTINLRKEKWDFNASLGYYAGGPGHELADFLHTAGYNWNLSTKKCLPYKLEINRRIKTRFNIGVGFYSINQSLVWDDMGWDNSKFRTIIVCPLIGYNFRDLLYLNIGPAINKISYYHPTGSSLTDEATYLKAGFVLKSTLKIPQNTRMFFLFEVSYSFSNTISTEYHIEIPGHQYYFRRLNVTNLPVNYFYIGTGIGMRLFQYKKPL